MTADASQLPRLAVGDDSLHPRAEDDPFVTETRWFGFAVPERRLSGVIYPVVRPNQAVASLGVYLWDDTGLTEEGSLYFNHLWHVPMPADLRDFQLLGGFSHRCLNPLTAYQVSYDDGVELRLRLRYEGLHDAVGRGHGGPVNGFTQICRVTGSISLSFPRRHGRRGADHDRAFRLPVPRRRAPAHRRGHPHRDPPLGRRRRRSGGSSARRRGRPVADRGGVTW